MVDYEAMEQAFSPPSLEKSALFNPQAFFSRGARHGGSEIQETAENALAITKMGFPAVLKQRPAELVHARQAALGLLASFSLLTGKKRLIILA